MTNIPKAKNIVYVIDPKRAILNKKIEWFSIAKNNYDISLLTQERNLDFLTSVAVQLSGLERWQMKGC